MRGACQQRDIEVPEAHYNQLEASSEIAAMKLSDVGSECMYK